MTEDEKKTEPKLSTAERHDGRRDPIMQFFRYEHEHLPLRLRAISRPFCELAESLVHTSDAGNALRLPRNAERSVALRKLLEAKDAAVRAFVAAPEGES